MSIAIDFPTKVYTVPIDTAMKIPLIKELVELKESENDLTIHLTVGEDVFDYILYYTGSTDEKSVDLKNDDEFINRLYQILIYYQIDLSLFMKQVKQLVLKRHRGRFTKFLMSLSGKPVYYSERMCKNSSISEEFFEKNIDKIHWSALCSNSSISEEFFEKYGYPSNPKKSKINWFNLCGNTNISEKFFEKYLDKVDWTSLSRNSNISEAFFEKYGNLSSLTNCKLDWEEFCRYHPVSETFFEKYLRHRLETSDTLNIALMQNSNISESFLEKYLFIGDYINAWSFLCENSNISEEFFEKYMNEMLDYNPYNIEYLCYNKNLSDAFIEKHLSKFLEPKRGEVRKMELFRKITRHRSDEFIDKYVVNRMSFESLISNSSVSMEFLKKHKDSLDFETLSGNDHIKIDNPFEWLN